MKKSDTLPATRVPPSLRRRIEAVLEKNETLSAFIETAVVRQAAWREERAAFLRRGLEAEQAGDWVSPREVFSAIRQRVASARRSR